MNRAVDARSDFYSLGATLYELLCGQPPFSVANPMELIHSHLAKRPKPVHEVRPDIPWGLSMLLQKLLAKDPEDRYQTAPGIRADLLQAASCLQRGETVEFPLALHDVAAALQIPKKLYGRKTDVETLLSAFERVTQGVNRLVLVSGPAGIGKSSLVHELYKPLTTHRGYFIHGKFDQLQRNTPCLFEPFFTTKGNRGTGLGLGIVKRITELYDGSLQFATCVGSGTEFTVTLPNRQQGS